MMKIKFPLQFIIIINLYFNFYSQIYFTVLNCKIESYIILYTYFIIIYNLYKKNYQNIILKLIKLKIINKIKNIYIIKQLKYNYLIKVKNNI